MKKVIITALVLLGGFLFATAVHAESITSWQSDITVQQDSTVSVTETIEYSFGNQQRHGIYRSIPYSYIRDGAKYNVRIQVQSVTDEDGATQPYSTTKWGGELEIKIGDADIYVSGTHTYVITYTIQRAINYFDDHDELYWNVTGTEWDVPIHNALATVSLSGVIDKQDLRVACYTGIFGSTNQYCNWQIGSDGIIAIYADRQLDSYEGMSFVLGMPKGVVTRPSTWQQVRWWLADNWPIAIPFIVIIGMFYIWFTHGRDPEGRGTIIPRYKPPRDMTAGEMGTVVDEKVDLNDISATIIQLAIKGYLKIKEIDRKKLLGKTRDYELIKIKEADDTLGKHEQEILKTVFDTGDTKTVSRMKNKFYIHLKDIKKAMYEQVVADEYFPTNPEKVRQRYGLFTAPIVILGAIVLFAFSNIVAGVAIMLSGGVALIFSRFMPRKTKRGAEIHEHIEGFKLFLSVTEKERLKFHNAPERSPKQFEEYLPYAMVLGVEKEWADQFGDMYVTPPEWYEGHPTSFGALYLASSLGSMNASMGKVMASRPGGSGGSGFSSGGGFSGGGFGGGGGGSW